MYSLNTAKDVEVDKDAIGGDILNCLGPGWVQRRSEDGELKHELGPGDPVVRLSSSHFLSSQIGLHVDAPNN
jgi:hypothetical protein